MRRVAPILLALYSCSLEAADIGLLPQDKTPVVLEQTERNPFGKRVAKVAEAQKETGVEEGKIRETLASLPVSGIIESPTKRRVLLGSMALEEGTVLPPVIKDQTERLKVKTITEKVIDIVFIGTDGTETDRRILVEVTVAPGVRHLLGSETGGTGALEPKGTKFGATIKTATSQGDAETGK